MRVFLIQKTRKFSKNQTQVQLNLNIQSLKDKIIKKSSRIKALKLKIQILNHNQDLIKIKMILPFQKQNILKCNFLD